MLFARTGRSARVPSVYRLLIELERDPEFIQMLPDLTRLNDAARPIMLAVAVFNDVLMGDEHGLPVHEVVKYVAARRMVRPRARTLIKLHPVPQYIALFRFGIPLAAAHLLRIDDLSGIPEIITVIEAQKYFTIPLTVIVDCHVKLRQRKVISFRDMLKLLDTVRVPGPRLFANIDMCAEVLHDEERGLTVHQCMIVDGECLVSMRDVKPEEVNTEIVFARHIVDKSGNVRTIIAYAYNVEKLLTDSDLLYSWGAKLEDVTLVSRTRREGRFRLFR